MGVPKKRGKFYYANTRTDGVRLRDCLETSNWQEALRRQRELVENVHQGKISAQKKPEWLAYTTAEALDVLIEKRKQDRKAERTIQIDKERAKRVKELLGEVSIKKLDADAIRVYQQKRLAERVSGRTINMEVTLIRLVLKEAKRWNRIADDVTNLPEHHDVVGRVLKPAEKSRLFKVAASNENWYRALYAAVIAVNTTARKIEVLRTRWHDIDLFAKEWKIPHSKTPAGTRIISLNNEALTAFLRMRQLGEKLGGGELRHYVFPACENKQFDFNHHQKSVRTAWRKLTEQAGLKGFRLHDLRHQAITEMAEADVPESVMKSLAGHVSKKMLEHYTHIRTAAKQKAVTALGGTGIQTEGSSNACTEHSNIQ